MNFSNFTRYIIVDGSSIDTMYITTPQVNLTQAVRDNSTVFTGSDYATDPPGFTTREVRDFVSRTSQSVINASGALTAWDKVTAIQDFLINGNDTYTFLRNNNGTNPPTTGIESDLSFWMLNNSFEGSCDQFTSLFAVMLRTVEVPVRKVTGFSEVTGMVKHSRFTEKTSLRG